MKSLSNISQLPISTPILADEIVEFHAARLLLLFRICGVNGQINGLTKMAKLDFFVRYPQFFGTACQLILPIDKPNVWLYNRVKIASQTLNEKDRNHDDNHQQPEIPRQQYYQRQDRTDRGRAA